MFCPTNFFSNQIQIDQFEKKSVGHNMNIWTSHSPPSSYSSYDPGNHNWREKKAKQSNNKLQTVASVGIADKQQQMHQRIVSLHRRQTRFRRFE